ncbi:DEAD/DEAH box helicase [Arcobacter defluvii]|uniref:DEAD-box ATP-dependent RNA helicase n=1 Tax=Arcobacter defluvii TaxID=873191 RepID=A0AAE7BG64_9BACT|nr:DEAD/DEAH box helicase [Arcobacter defluvii]QKF77204.1 DEAD-box ATP-dependent RNA helicase [Arcobacter defluvii]RXI33506.1 DEAD/DEAH box helicase [Arcobacter defluvii]
MPFLKLNLLAQLNKSLVENDYINPTLIQEKVIPLILEKKDIIAKAQTGSGKTASFVLPLLQLWTNENYEGKAKIKALVLAPTRELALQISSNFEMFSKYLAKKPKIVSVIGGENLGQQLLDIQKGCDIVVATTGRLVDIINKKQLDLSKLEFFILDEADKMLDLGFEKELEILLEMIPTNRQNLLFSATYPTKIQNIISKITKKAIEVSIDEMPTVQKINQRAIAVNIENRSPLLRYLISTNNWEQILVFMANKRACDNIAFKFRKYNFDALSFHGDLSQEERNETLKDFKNKKIKILFATDIAARGLHIDDISCVVNFDLPRATADYIHRIGRTGRAGKSGEAISFIGLKDFEHFALIEKRCNIKLEKEQIEGFELIGTPQKIESTAPKKGKRKSKKDKLREQNLKD